MTGKDLFLVLGDIHYKFYDEAEHDTIASPATVHRPFRKTFLIAAIIATMLLLGMVACARYVGIHLMLNQRNMEILTGQIGEIPGTETAAAVRNALTDCYPQVLPQGYSVLEGAPVDRSTRTISYSNGANNNGAGLEFYISTSHDFYDFQINMESTAEQKKQMRIGACTATYLASPQGGQMLLWHNEADGYYACLSTRDAEVDLSAMAESVGFGEKLPLSFLYNRGKLWDIWYPQKLPEGYVCTDVSPVSGAVQSVSYRKDTGDSINYCISLFTDMSDISNPPYSSIKREERTVWGKPAKLITIGSQQRILCWHNEQEGFYARLDTEDESVDLVAIAESVMPGEKLEVSSNYLGPDYTIEMRQAQAKYFGWGSIYPQEIPEGYSLSFVSDPSYGEQAIHYENAAGDVLIYIFYYRLGEWGRAFEGMGQPEQVDINGNIGYLTESGLIWTDAAQGYGFWLCTSTEMDLVAIAKSVGSGPELEPTYADRTEKALEQLGDYQITALPKGMVLDGLACSPLEGGGGWYAYVRRWYYNKRTNAELYFEYESYITDGSLSEEDVVRMDIGSGGDTVVQTVTINGCTGAALQEERGATVAWVLGDETKGIVFKLFSKAFSVEELLEIAQSIQKSA